MHDIKFIDETFDINLTHSYELSIQVTLNGFSFCILDTLRNKCIALSFYTIDENSTFDELINRIEDILNKDMLEYSNFSFKKIRCIYHSPRYTIVPDILFDKEKTHEYFKFSNYLEELDEINFNYTRISKNYIVFTLPSTLSNLLIQKFKNIEFYSHITAAIENISSNMVQGHDKVYINTDNGHIDIIATKDEHFQLINSFPFDNEKDAVYYILNTYQQFQFKENEIPLYYSGNNEKSALLLPELKKFIGVIKPLKLNDKITFSYQFNKIQKHQFANLISSFLCE